MGCLALCNCLQMKRDRFDEGNNLWGIKLGAIWGGTLGVAVQNIASVYPVVQSTTQKAKIRPIHPGNVNKTRSVVSPGLLSDRMLKHVDLS